MSIPAFNRFLLIEKICPFCIKYFPIINRINANLPPENRIRIIDTTDFENWGVQLNPIIERIEYEGTPTLYIDGIEISGATTSYWIEGFLKAYLKEEFLIQD